MMNKIVLFYVLLISYQCQASDDGAFYIDLEDYNGWNLPYSKSVFLNVTDAELAPFVLPKTFQLLCNINAYFPIIFTGRPLPDISS